MTSLSPAVGEGVASGREALTLLDNPLTRNLFLDDLMEVGLLKEWFILLCGLCSLNTHKKAGKSIVC